MIKKLIKFLLFLIIITIIIIAYLSFFGINTKKFNDKIKTEVLNINKKVNLELKSVKFLLNLKNLSINVKTFSPLLVINDNKLEFERIKTNISLKSFLNKEFSIEDLQISTKTIELNDLVLLARSFKNSPELFIADSIIQEGLFVGDIKLSFDNNGKIKNDYEIKGFIKNGKLDILRKYSIENLNFIFNIKNNEFILEDIKSNLNQIKLSLPIVNIKKKNNLFSIVGKLTTKKNDINLEKLSNLLSVNFEVNGLENVDFSSINDFNFVVDKKFKISNFNLKSTINLNKLIYKSKSAEIRKYLPNFKELIELEEHTVLVNYKKDQLDITGDGKITIENKTDKFEYEIVKKKNEYRFNVNININKNPFLINILNYKKKQNSESVLMFSGIYRYKKKTTFNLISFKENSNLFLIKNLNLNNKFVILDVESLKLDYINNNKIKNQINLKHKNKKYVISGKSFDITKLIDEILLGKDDKEPTLILGNFNYSLNLKIIKTYLDKKNYVNNLSGDIIIKNNKIDKLNLISTFPNKNKLNLTIQTNENNEKITTFFTDFPKPFIKRYKFIDGFEGGVLDFYSIEKDDMSNSLLTVNNFKIKEVPIFAKLLSLASLQGIADLLTGEGIRFTDFEMKFSNKKKLMTIEELYSIGPAVSILMNGYIENKGLTSLRGTLVPATTINRTIASIPLIGDILVGKKVGEGVFGVSFKIKGPPDDLKTVVNPIKTLTPRFITRTLEKIKKN